MIASGGNPHSASSSAVVETLRPLPSERAAAIPSPPPKIFFLRFRAFSSAALRHPNAASRVCRDGQFHLPNVNPAPRAKSPRLYEHQFCLRPPKRGPCSLPSLPILAMVRSPNSMQRGRRPLVRSPILFCSDTPNRQSHRQLSASGRVRALNTPRTGLTEALQLGFVQSL